MTGLHQTPNEPQEGVSMTAPTEPVVPAAPVVPPAQEPPPPAVVPPWGDQANFDPEKAWKLIEDLRSDKEKLAARTAITPEQSKQLADYQALVEASKTEAQRQADAVTAANAQAAQASADATRYKVAALHGISKPEDLDLLGSGTEEEVTARAQRIAALNAAAVTGAPVPPVPGAPITRPIEQLRPGATPAGTPTDDDAVYTALFGPQT